MEVAMPIGYTEETDHFFQWLMRSRQVDLNDLMKRATAMAEADPWLSESHDFPTVFRDKLAEELQEVLSRRVDRLPAKSKLIVTPEKIMPEVHCLWDSPESLWLPILALALSRIDCKAAAERILDLWTAQHGDRPQKSK
jgi:hypothetical protein